jgi:hypothetical protein
MVSETTKDLLESTYAGSFLFEEGRNVHISTSDRSVQGYFIEPLENESE